MSHNPTEAQIETIVGAAVEKAVADTAERLTAAFKAETDGLLANRNELLAENRRLKGKPVGEPPRRTHDRYGQPFDRFYTQEDEDRHLAFMARHGNAAGNDKKEDSIQSPGIRNGTQEVFISREDARDVQKYRAAKAAAEARGVPLRIVNESAPVATSSQAGNPTLRSFDDPVHKHRYLRRDQLQGSLIRHRLAAERDGLQLVVFSSLDELDENGLAAYREAGGDA